MRESGLTPKQKQVLEWIEVYLSQNQILPSRREIAEGLGLSSPATIQQHIEALEQKGFLRRPDHQEARVLQWTAKGKQFSKQAQQIQAEARAGKNTDSQSVDIPFLGSIAAGYPIEVFTSEQTLNVHLSFFFQSSLGKLGEIFALKVRGDSMIDEGIFNGDVVILKKTLNPKNGQAVAALLNGEATLKTFVRTKEKIELHPANPRFSIIPVREEDRFEVQGVVVGLMRKY